MPVRLDDLDRIELKADIDAALSNLTPREQYVITKHFGLDGHNPYTFKGIGQQLNVTAERIRQIQGKGLQKLRKILKDYKPQHHVMKTRTSDLSLGIKAVEDVARDDGFWREIYALFGLYLAGASRKLILEGARAAESAGVIVDFDQIHQGALRITRIAESRYWASMAETTRAGLQEALIAWQEVGLGKRGIPDLIDSTEPLFGRDRAKRIAVTEATRLFADGNELAGDSDPVVGGYQFQTAGDERVCERCGPRDGLIYPKGDIGNKPPIHTRCRCGWIPTSWRYIRAHPSKWQGAAIPEAVT